MEPYPEQSSANMIAPYPHIEPTFSLAPGVGFEPTSPRGAQANHRPSTPGLGPQLHVDCPVPGSGIPALPARFRSHYFPLWENLDAILIGPLTGALERLAVKELVHPEGFTLKPRRGMCLGSSHNPTRPPDPLRPLKANYPVLQAELRRHQQHVQLVESSNPQLSDSWSRSFRIY